MLFKKFDYDLRDKLREVIPTKLQDIAKVYYEQKIQDLEDFLENSVYEDKDELQDAWDKLYQMNIGLAYFVNDEYTNYIINDILPKCIEHKLPLKESYDNYFDKQFMPKMTIFDDLLNDIDIEDDLHKVVTNKPDDNPDIEELRKPMVDSTKDFMPEIHKPVYTCDYTSMDPFDGSTPYFDMMSSSCYSTTNDTCKCHKECECKENNIPDIKLNTESDKKNLEKYEMVQHPHHYNTYSVEVIDMFEKIYGPARVADWCEITALKYRLRMGTKPDNSIKQDLDKEEWYLKKAKELREKIKK